MIYVLQLLPMQVMPIYRALLWLLTMMLIMMIVMMLLVLVEKPSGELNFPPFSFFCSISMVILSLKLASTLRNSLILHIEIVSCDCNSCTWALSFQILPSTKPAATLSLLSLHGLTLKPAQLEVQWLWSLMRPSSTPSFSPKLNFAFTTRTNANILHGMLR